MNLYDVTIMILAVVLGSLSLHYIIRDRSAIGASLFLVLIACFGIYIFYF